MDLSFNICHVCNKLMSDPRILPCAHSFCLQCLETLTISRESSTCPTCQMDFEIPQGGLTDLKKNEFISKLQGLKQSFEICNSCEKIQASKFCVDCSYSFCLSCLDCHKNIPVARNHQITELDAKPEKVDNKKYDYEVCGDHGETKTLFCKDCKNILCGMCLVFNHNGHKIMHMSQVCDEMKTKLNDEIGAKEFILKDIKCNHKSSENVKNENERRANDLKKEIEKRGQKMKKNIDSIVEEFKQIVDEKLKECNKNADDILLKLENLNKNINAHIETLKQQLNDLKDKKFIETSTLKEKFENIPKYEDYFELTLTRDRIENEIKTIFGMIGDGKSETTYQFTVNISSMTQIVYSPEFNVRQIPWCLRIEPYKITQNADSKKYLAIYLYCEMNSKLKGWSCNAKYKFKLLSNKPDSKIYASHEASYNFPCGNGRGPHKFIRMDELLDPNNGCVKDGSVTFEVDVKADEPKGV